MRNSYLNISHRFIRSTGRFSQAYFGRTFDVYTRLWKFQQQHRQLLDIKYGLKVKLAEIGIITLGLHRPKKMDHLTCPVVFKALVVVIPVGSLMCAEGCLTSDVPSWLTGTNRVYTSILSIS